MLARLVSSEVLLPLACGCHVPIFVLTWSSLCIRLHRDPLFIYGHQSYWIRVHPCDLIYLNHLLKGPSSKCYHILRYWALGLQRTGSWKGHNPAHNMDLKEGHNSAHNNSQYLLSINHVCGTEDTMHSRKGKDPALLDPKVWWKTQK